MIYKYKNKQGYTLMEVMVSVLLLILLTTVTTSIFLSFLTESRRGEAERALLDQARDTIAIIKNDLRTAQVDYQGVSGCHSNASPAVVYPRVYSEYNPTPNTILFLDKDGNCVGFGVASNEVIKLVDVTTTPVSIPLTDINEVIVTNFIITIYEGDYDGLGGDFYTVQPSVTILLELEPADNTLGINPVIIQETIPYPEIGRFDIFTKRSEIPSCDIQAGARFGYPMAKDGNTLAVGNLGGARPRDICVFEYDGTTWNATALLIVDEVTNDMDFPFDIDINGDTIVVGSEIWDPPYDGGKAYVYNKVGGVWGNCAGDPLLGCTQSMDLLGSTVITNTRRFFGLIVAITDTAIFVSEPESNTTSNAAGEIFVFVKNGLDWGNCAGVSPKVCSETQTLVADTSIDFASIGWIMDVSTTQDYSFVAVKTEKVSGSLSGGVLLFEDNGDGTWGTNCSGASPDQCSESALLMNTDNRVDDGFPGDIDINDDLILIGRSSQAPWDDQGAYIYEYNSSVDEWGNCTGTVCTENVKLKPSIDPSSGGGEWFGVNVAINDTVAVVRKESSPFFSEVYIYTYNGTDWGRCSGGFCVEDKILRNSPPETGFGFGAGLAIEGDLLYVSDSNDDSNGLNAGKLFIYETEQFYQ